MAGRSDERRGLAAETAWSCSLFSALMSEAPAYGMDPPETGRGLPAGRRCE